MELRAAVPDDAEACVSVIAALPEYFTASTHDEVRQGLATHPAWLAVEEGRIIGFVLARRRFAGAAEIAFAAVTRESRGQGVGTVLVEHALGALAADGVAMVEVKTLDASAGYEPYVATRAFWELRGFIQIDCVDPFPGWEPGNPCAIYVRAVVART